MQFISDLRPVPDPDPAIGPQPSDSEGDTDGLEAAPPLMGPQWSQTLDFLWKTHSYINDYIRFADQKSGVSIVFSTSLLGVYQGRNLYARLLAGTPVTWRFTEWLIAVGVAVLTCAVICAAWAIRPRLRGVPRAGYVYWGAIQAFGSSSGLWSSISSETPEGLTRYMSDQVFNASAICEQKFRWANRSVMASIVGGALSGLVLLLS